MADEIKPYQFQAVKHEYDPSPTQPGRCRCGRAYGFVLHKRPVNKEK